MLNQLQFNNPEYQKAIKQAKEDEQKVASEIPKPVAERVSNLVYYLTVVLYTVLIGVTSILVDDLTFVFGIIGGFSECSINYILPGLFYIISARKVAIKAPMHL